VLKTKSNILPYCVSSITTDRSFTKMFQLFEIFLQLYPPCGFGYQNQIIYPSQQHTQTILVRVKFIIIIQKLSINLSTNCQALTLCMNPSYVADKVFGLVYCLCSVSTDNIHVLICELHFTTLHYIKEKHRTCHVFLPSLMHACPRHGPWATCIPLSHAKAESEFPTP
jgi:hypothetical protein